MKGEIDKSGNSSRRVFFKTSFTVGVGTLLTGLSSNQVLGQSESGQLTERAKKLMNAFSLKFLIFQAPTAGPAGTTLAIAVANSGAMGALPLTWHSIDDAVNAVLIVKNESKGSFFVNYVLTHDPMTLDHILTAGAKTIQFSFGIPTEKMVDTIRKAGAKFGVQVTSKQNAINCIKYAPDYFACQGIEAGGHIQSSRSLTTCLKEVIEVAQEIPVLASGGIATGHDIRVRLNEGASGAILGTRFVATQESDAHPDYKQAIVKAKERDNVLTLCFYKSGFKNVSVLQKVLRNDTLQMWEDAGCPTEGQRLGEKDIVATFENGRTLERYSDTPPTKFAKGAVTSLAMYAGQGIKDIKDIPTVNDLIQKLWRELNSKKVR